jgi:tetratricopeptide (TPR) repeat protein
MSLLIKALDKAQDAKVKQAEAEADKEKLTKLEQIKEPQEKRSKSLKTDLENTELGANLTLSPPQSHLLDESNNQPTIPSPSNLGSAAFVAKKEQASNEIATNSPEALSLKTSQKTTNGINQNASKSASNHSQAQAATVFAAKRFDATHQNTKLVIIAGIGLIVLLAMGIYYYQFIDSAPPVRALPSRTPQIAVSSNPMPSPPRPIVEESVSQVTPIQLEVKESPKSDISQTVEHKAPVKVAQKQNIIKSKIAEDVVINTENTLDSNEVIVAPTKKNTKLNIVKMDKAIASESASIQVSQSKPQDAINPLVLRAYDAYYAGKDNEAQKLYKQALQRDGLNVDALLGLGAIASRQGRIADAGGWYRKVLELDPKNTTALAALADVQELQDPQMGESRLKSLLAKSPNDANLNAALGNLYADQNQWSAAQQAYFEAYRLNESADNAFNLAVSLDQMGKPKLALPYYQQALQMAQQSSANNIDKAALEARIAAIQ